MFTCQALTWHAAPRASCGYQGGGRARGKARKWQHPRMGCPLLIRPDLTSLTAMPTGERSEFSGGPPIVCSTWMFTTCQPGVRLGPSTGSVPSWAEPSAGIDCGESDAPRCQAVAFTPVTSSASTASSSPSSGPGNRRRADDPGRADRGGRAGLGGRPGLAGRLAMTGRLKPEPEREPGSTTRPFTVMAGGGELTITLVPVVAS
jgi:hypothetical protein